MTKIDESAWEKGYVAYWGSSDPVLAIKKCEDGSYLLGGFSPSSSQIGSLAFAKHKDKHKLLAFAIHLSQDFSYSYANRKVYHLNSQNQKTLLWENGQEKPNEFPEE